MYGMKTSWRIAIASAAMALAGASMGAADIPPSLLMLPEGYTMGAALTVNSSNQIAGMVVGIESPTTGCVWTNGLATLLPLLPGYLTSQPADINSAGVVVGFCETAAYNARAVRWNPGAALPDDLGSLSGATSSSAIAINEQGQVLCANNDRYSLWEEGIGHMEIITPEGGKIDASGEGPFSQGALLMSNGRVAGTAEVGHWDGSTWVLEYYQAVLWDKNGLVPIITHLSTAAGGVDTVSPNGKVVGYAEPGGYFIYDANTELMTDIDMPSNPDFIYVPNYACSVNDSGQAVFLLSVYDGLTEPFPLLRNELWLWDAGTWTLISFEGIMGSGSPYYLIATINSSSQVAGTVIDYSNTYVPFSWTAENGVQKLLVPSGYFGVAIGLSESGWIVGGAQNSSTSSYLPLYWDPEATMTFSIASVTKTSKGVTVIVEIGNATTDVLKDVTLSKAELGGVATKASLPIKVGTLKPGVIKEVKLVFRTVQAGAYDLDLEGTSTLGAFTASLPVLIP